MDPVAESRARIHAYVNVGLLVFLLSMHAVFGLSTLANVGMLLAGHGPYTGFGSSSFDQGRLLGNVIAFSLTGLWSLAGLVWIPFNIYGLLKRRPWASLSTLVYWVMSILTICCAPFGIYGVISMLSKDMKTYLHPEA